MDGISVFGLLSNATGNAYNAAVSAVTQRGSPVTGSAGSVTRHGVIRRDEHARSCRDDARNPINTGFLVISQPDLNL
jgi:hypothetical protein